ncbi:phosphoglycerate kinase [Sediminispirochaeta smaragdinae]|uniref:Phosphoglycerate kinase n=1 Tax=Sediminispirochaeta smaragdinae (strain DSM 11293 / JCM 15392 / SEBR 4228) TaxID=573413 RepID=E1RCP3_SEDSS|nr:phosphoglycerate kinase [Sediminispirochaeta smaragdinae]ADK80123.1 Phosphoglycerate kinase [Sediminispirochaeta smaragdinae DSM 11293]
MAEVSLGFKPMEAFDVKGKRVLLRVDINSPIDPKTKRIVNENRIQKSLPTISWLLDHGAKLAMIAHQGDTLDYQNLIPLEEHAQKLSDGLGRPVGYIDDVCGPAAQKKVKELAEGEAILLGNLRYLCEEISTFENAVKLKAEEMLDTYLVRSLVPLFDLYINDAFAAAHRNAPSMVAFQELLPSAAGPLFFKEVSALTKVMKSPEHPSVFVLGGAKISDAFGMMEQVLSSGTADKILACGVTGEVMLIASGRRLGKATDKFLADKGLDVFIEPAAKYLKEYPGRIIAPDDLAYEENGKRQELSIEALPKEALFLDIGTKTIERFEAEIKAAGTVFVNGPAGVFEDDKFAKGTQRVWQAIASAPGYTVVGGGDSVNAAARFTNMSDYSYVCTAGGAMVRFLSGKKLPLIAAMEKAGKKWK